MPDIGYLLFIVAVEVNEVLALRDNGDFSLPHPIRTIKLQ